MKRASKHHFKPKTTERVKLVGQRELRGGGAALGPLAESSQKRKRKVGRGPKRDCQHRTRLVSLEAWCSPTPSWVLRPSCLKPPASG